MGAGDWVSGGLRRAVSGVRSALPGQGEAEPAQEPTRSAAVASTRATPTKVTPKPTAEQPAPTVPAEKATATKPTARKATPKKATATKAATKQAPKPAADTPPAAVTPIEATAPTPPPAAPAPAVPTWSDEELAGFRVALETDIIRLREELHMEEADMADLLADSSDGAGDDQADAGSKTLEREQEMSVNANARDLLDQSTHALRRLVAGTYGICESCGTLIPAARLRAFPRATLCIACKQAEERR
ncbi:MAG TPA: TraR/DksA C4-type zinc finger protein [Candidatus Limnocylindrales bacterium]|nr:TraR/DksA C4-type zinc finger protein [Candidatus Limnocylindrales bacterium]